MKGRKPFYLANRSVQSQLSRHYTNNLLLLIISGNNAYIKGVEIYRLFQPCCGLRGVPEATQIEYLIALTQKEWVWLHRSGNTCQD